MNKTYDIAAYVWPAYHDEPRWRPFMPDGEGEWQTIRQAKPHFDGHQQPRVPLWGYTDEADPLVMERKIDAAADHGVNVFIYDWYWYEDQPFLEDALGKGFLGARNNDRMKFFLMWANHDATTLWDLDRSHQREVLWKGAVDRPTFDHAVSHAIKNFFSHPSYYRIDGKPVFSIYEISTLIEGLGGMEATREALQDFRAKVRAAGFPDLHLQGVLWGRIPKALSAIPGDRTETQDNTIQALGFDSLTNYQWCHYVSPKGPYVDWGRKAVEAWAKWAKEFSVPFYPHVSVGWDTNPRFKHFVKDLVVDATPEAFGRFLGEAMAFVDAHSCTPPLITINSWNEWGEGSYLEPDSTFGMGYLETVREVLQRHAVREPVR